MIMTTTYVHVKGTSCETLPHHVSVRNNHLTGIQVSYHLSSAEKDSKLGSDPLLPSCNIFT